MGGPSSQFFGKLLIVVLWLYHVSLIDHAHENTVDFMRVYNKSPFSWSESSGGVKEFNIDGLTDAIRIDNDIPYDLFLFVIIL